MASEQRSAARPGWTFLTNHSHVLLCIQNDPDARLRDIADLVGITERAAQTIVADLEEAGYVRRRKVGRRNHYELTADKPLRHPLESHRNVSDLLAMLRRPPAGGANGRRQAVAGRGSRS